MTNFRIDPPSERTRLGVIVGLGIVGGAGAISIMRAGLREGLDREGRRGLLAAAAVGLGGYAAAQIWKIDKEWWFTVEAAAKKAYDVGKKKLQPALVGGPR